MRQLRLGIVVACLCCTVVFGQVPKNLIRKEVRFGEPVNLQEFGGPNVSVIVRNREMSSIGITLVDYTQQVATARNRGNGVSIDGTPVILDGRNNVILNPLKVSKAVPKESGFSPDGRASEAYLIHRDPSGVRVFFYDTLDVKQNHCALLIEPIAKARDIGGATERLQELERLRAGGLITEKEYEAKRKEILSEL